MSNLECPSESVAVDLLELGLWGTLSLQLGGEEFLLFTIDPGLAAVEINVLGLDDGGLHHELVADEHDDVERESEVGGDESLGIESCLAESLPAEQSETLEECNQDGED